LEAHPKNVLALGWPLFGNAAGGKPLEQGIRPDKCDPDQSKRPVLEEPAFTNKPIDLHKFDINGPGMFKALRFLAG